LWCVVGGLDEVAKSGSISEKMGIGSRARYLYRVRFDLVHRRKAVISVECGETSGEGDESIGGWGMLLNRLQVCRRRGMTPSTSNGSGTRALGGACERALME
jgi:hypothetical protein